VIPAALAAILTPLLGNGLNLVANAVMAKGRDYVEQRLGVSLKPDMSPEDLAKIQIAQMEHEEELLKLRLEHDSLDLAELQMLLKDTNDARQREVQIANSDKAPLLNKIVTPVLALSILLLTFVLFGVVMFNDTPVEASRKDILIYILGVLSAIASQIVSYYFGSSAGSKEKTEAMKEAMK
jgi:acyl carrier protein